MAEQFQVAAKNATASLVLTPEQAQRMEDNLQKAVIKLRNKKHKSLLKVSKGLVAVWEDLCDANAELFLQDS